MAFKDPLQLKSFCGSVKQQAVIVIKAWCQKFEEEIGKAFKIPLKITCLELFSLIFFTQTIWIDSTDMSVKLNSRVYFTMGFLSFPSKAIQHMEIPQATQSLVGSEI